jgi:hypothetical protein
MCSPCVLIFQVKYLTVTGKDLQLGNSVGKHVCATLDRVVHKTLLPKFSWHGTAEKASFAQFEHVVRVVKRKRKVQKHPLHVHVKCSVLVLTQRFRFSCHGEKLSGWPSD